MKNLLIITGKKTTIFQFFDKKMSKTRLSKFLKLRSLLFVNDCFKSESNAVFGVFLQRLIISVLIVSSMLSSCQAQDKKGYSFDNFKLDETSAWSSHITGNGVPCKWEIINDAGNNVLAQVSKETEDYRFNIIVNDNLQYKNLEIKVKFKGVEGKGDQGGGPVWRYQDENNYYVARANPLENNFRVYKVVNGRRIELKSANITINSNQWYNIKITMIDNEIKCYFNNKLELELSDNTFKNAGKIGLWTKSDAVTYFDDFEIIPLK